MRKDAPLDLSLRRAVPNDAPTLASVHVDSWQSAYRGLVPDAFLSSFTYEHRTDRFPQALASNSEETYVVARNGEVLGILTLAACRDSDVDSDTAGEIWGIYLAPQHWRKGIGRFLSDRAEDMLRSRGFTQATLWVLEGNNSARRFYELRMAPCTEQCCPQKTALRNEERPVLSVIPAKAGIQINLYPIWIPARAQPAPDRDPGLGRNDTFKALLNTAGSFYSNFDVTLEWDAGITAGRWRITGGTGRRQGGSLDEGREVILRS